MGFENNTWRVADCTSCSACRSRAVSWLFARSHLLWSRKRFPPSPSLGSCPTALRSRKAQPPISDATSFLLPPAHRDTLPAHPLLSPWCSPAPQVPHSKGGEGSAACPFLCSCLFLPLWDHHFQPLHLHQQDLSQPCASSSLTHCYPLVLDQAGDRHIPGESRHCRQR